MIFGDSDEEGTKDIDFLGIDEDDEESYEVNSESGNEGAWRRRRMMDNWPQ